jgi:hypothetical protein
VTAINGGSWSNPHAADVVSEVPYVRISDERSDTTFHNYVNAGAKVIRLFAGCYSGSGVSGCGDPTTLANHYLSWYKANTNPSTTPYIEIFNEPYGTWFWGSNAYSQSNADAYTRYQTFHAQYGSSAPKVLGACEAYNSWCKKWVASTAVSNPLQYVDMVTVHPYGGTGDRTQSALGNRGAVGAAHSLTNKPVLVTEVGWPTCGSTSDSLSWSEQDEANNVYNFVNWARGTGYVSGVSIYEDVDEIGRCYGTQHHDLTHKPAFHALHCAALGKQESC